ncbi:MAG: DUF6941 family protein [Verrucomicrobiota bacterium]
MLPDLQSALACEDVRMEVNGSNTIVGVINVIAVPMVPFRVIKLCVYTRWVSGDGEFNQKVRILTPDEKELGVTETRFKITPHDAHTTNIAIFSGMEFSQFGDYPVEIFLNTDLRLRFPLRAVKLPGFTPPPEAS